MDEHTSPSLPGQPAPRAGMSADVVAGLSIAGLLLPEAVAYAGIAGMPPQAGVIALLAGLVCYGLIGTSRFAIVSATSSSAAVLLAATTDIAGPDVGLRLVLAAGLILLTGLFFIAAGLAKLGGVSAFIARPVLRGFAFGLAVTIVIKQVPNIVDIHVSQPDIFRYTWDLLSGWARWNRAGLLIAVVALVLLKVLGRWHKVPGALLVIAGGIVLDAAGVTAAHGVAVVGPINLTLSAPALPDIAREHWLRLGEIAVALLLILYAESYGSIRTFAVRHGDNTDANRDLIALGVANCVSGLFHGLAVGAGFSATSANEAAGAQSRRAGWVAAAVVLALVVTVLHWIERTPQPILAAIVIHAVGHSISPATFKSYFTWHRDRIVALSAVAAVLALGVLNGLLAAIAVSLAMLLRSLSGARVSVLGRLYDSHDFVDISRHTEALATPGILILRPEAALFFANADRMFVAMRHHLDSAGSIRTLVLSLEESPNFDSTTIDTLGEFATYLHARGIHLLLARVKDAVRDVLLLAGLPYLADDSFAAWSVDDAVKAATAALPQ